METAHDEDVEMVDVSREDAASSDCGSRVNDDGDDCSQPKLSPTQSSDRQFGIWCSRVHRELAKCSQLGALPAGVTLKNTCIDEARGACVGEFHCFVPFQEGSDALALIPLAALRVSMPYDAARQARGDAQYPFLAPEVTVVQGSVYLPSEMVTKASPTTAHGSSDPLSRAPCSLLLPTLTHWSPSNTLVMILHDFVATVQKYDPPVVSKPPTSTAGANAAAGTPAARMRLRKRDIVAPIHSCHEIDPVASTLVATPMLLQTGNIVLLVPPRASDAPDDPFVYVSSVIPLKEVARITPQRGKSVTLFFRDRKLSCRTFLTRDTDAIVAALRQMIAATGVKRGRDGGSRGDDSNPLSQLLAFLSPEHSDRAKEMSSKFMGKLSKYASSMTRFLRGDDSDEEAKQRDHELFTSALSETSSLKNAFFRTPSRDRMAEITRRYQSIAEEFALRKNADGYVERAIDELQQFIEHPAARRILSETSACEQFNRGIRVGPV